MKRLYVITNQQLNPIYAAVQGAHCVAQWLLDHPEQTWNNEYLIFLTGDLEKAQYLIGDNDCSKFYEPDLGNELTSIAILGDDENKKWLKKFKLLK